MLLAHKDGIDLLQGCAFGLHPEDDLRVSGQRTMSSKMIGLVPRSATYNEDETDDIPATVDEVHLPSDVGQRDGNAVDKHNPDPIVSMHVRGKDDEILTRQPAGPDGRRPDRWRGWHSS